MSHSPEIVLQSIITDIKTRGMTQKEAARMLSYKCPQSLTNLLYSKKYLSKKQALHFNKVLGYNIDYLTNGEGDLIDTQKVEDRTHVLFSYCTLETGSEEKEEDVFIEHLLRIIKDIADILGEENLKMLYSALEEQRNYKEIVREELIMEEKLHQMSSEEIDEAYQLKHNQLLDCQEAFLARFASNNRKISAYVKELYEKRKEKSRK